MYTIQDGNSTFLNMTDSNVKTDNYSGMVCAEGYYLGDDSLCRPLCSLWVDPPGSIGLGNILNMFSAVIALFSSVIAIILALTIQTSTM